MGLWDSITDFGGGRFDGEMTPSGSGARIRAGVRDLPVIGDVNIVDVTVPGFAKGGVIGQSPADASRARLAALHQHRGPSGAQAAETHADARRRGRPLEAQAHRTAAPTPSDGRPAHPLAGPARGVLVDHSHRKKHEIAPGVPCPSCAVRFTIPVK